MIENFNLFLNLVFDSLVSVSALFVAYTVLAYVFFTYVVLPRLINLFKKIFR